MRDGNIGGVLSRTTSSGTFYYHYDGNGNVVAMTNSSGAIVAQYTYDAYGNLTAMSGSQAAANPIRFSTKYFDGNTGYYDFGFRSYDPVTGRWLNRDPIGEEGGLNLYGFVGNSPGNGVDAYGQNPWVIAGVSETRMGRLYSGSRTLLRSDFFDSKKSTLASQYTTLLHESYHAGTRDMTEEKSYAYADSKLSQLKKYGLKGVCK